MSENKHKFIGITDELKDKFKALLKEFNVVPVTPTPVTPAQPAPVAKFGEAKLKDGTVIKWEGEQPLSAGLALLIIDPNNPEGFLPAPDGEHELEDGTVVVVEGGLVKEVKAVAAPEVPMSAEVVAQFAEITEKFNAVSKEKSELEATLKSEIEANKKAVETLTNTVKEMFNLLGEAMDVPTANPVEVPQTSKGTKKERLLEKFK